MYLKIGDGSWVKFYGQIPSWDLINIACRQASNFSWCKAHFLVSDVVNQKYLSCDRSNLYHQYTLFLHYRKQAFVIRQIQKRRHQLFVPRRFQPSLLLHLFLFHQLLIRSTIAHIQPYNRMNSHCWIVCKFAFKCSLVCSVIIVAISVYFSVDKIWT